MNRSAWATQRTAMVWRCQPSKLSRALHRLPWPLGIAREITAGQRNRLFAYDAYLAILSEGAEPL